MSDDNCFPFYGSDMEIFGYKNPVLELEGKGNEIGFDEAIIGRNLPCGEEICNFGRAFSVTPLDKSIQEYENELLQDKLKK